MARGKHSQSVAAQKRAEAQSAEERARAAEIEQRRLQGVIADKDRELATLTTALVESRQKHTTTGTYTEAHLAILVGQKNSEHEAQVLAGVAALEGYFDMRPEAGDYVTKVMDIAALFRVDAMKLLDVFLGFTDDFEASTRREKRPKKSAARIADEVRRDLRVQLLTHSVAPEVPLNYKGATAQSFKGLV